MYLHLEIHAHKCVGNVSKISFLPSEVLKKRTSCPQERLRYLCKTCRNDRKKTSSICRKFSTYCQNPSNLQFYMCVCVYTHFSIQALRLSSEVYGGYVKVEEYSHGHHMKVVYWRPGSDQLLSAFLLDNSESESFM